MTAEEGSCPLTYPLSEEDLTRIAQAAAVAAYKHMALQTGKHPCIYSIDPEEHRKHHELVDEAIATLKRINEIKWSFLKTILILGGLALLGAAGWNIKNGG